MSVLLNNKASCLQHICDYKACINDCEKALGLLSSIENKDQLDGDEGEQICRLKVKLIWKKAYSFEALEKFQESVNEYENLIKLDRNYKNALQNCNRLKNHLKDQQFTSKSRDNASKNNFSSIDQTTQNKQNLYEEHKAKGNDCVKSNDFLKASEFYTKCIEVDEKNPVAYLNRSLCYVKLNKADLAISDCLFVLQNDPKNVKALYRQASAHRIKQELELAKSILLNLLKLEPNNVIAKKDLDEIEDLLQKRAQLTKEAQKNATKSEPKSNKVVNESKKEPEVVESVKVTKAQSSVSKLSSVSNAYEFLQAWNSINPRDIASFCELILKIQPKSLPLFIGTKLDNNMLDKMLEAIYKLRFDSTFNVSQENVFEILKHLAKVQRFDFIKHFIDSKQKKVLSEVFDSFTVQNDEVNSTRSKYF